MLVVSTKHHAMGCSKPKYDIDIKKNLAHTTQVSLKENTVLKK